MQTLLEVLADMAAKKSTQDAALYIHYGGKLPRAKAIYAESREDNEGIAYYAQFCGSDELHRIEPNALCVVKPQTDEKQLLWFDARFWTG